MKRELQTVSAFSEADGGDPSQNAIEVADRCKAETRGAGYLTPATGQGAGSPRCHCVIMVNIHGLCGTRLLC